MLVLNVDKLSRNFGYGDLFKDLSFSVHSGEVLSVVGPNGSGKSTLLKIIAGLENKDSGNINIKKDMNVAYLDQKSANNNDSRIVYDVLMDAFEEIHKMQESLKFYEDKMTSLDSESEEYMKTLEKYCTLMEKFSDIGGYDTDIAIQTVCDGLEINNDLLYQEYSSLSGGEKTLIQLARCLLTKPDLLLLDEPTNNLDIKRIEWLEQFIKDYKGGVIIVSHDRFFIDRVSSKILEIESGRNTIYNTNYTGYLEQKERNYEKDLALYKDQQEQIKHDIEMYRYFLQHNFPDKARYFKEKYEREMREAIPRPRKPRKIGINFGVEKKFSKRLIETKDLTVTTEDNTQILKNVNILINANENVALLGNNGSGKSTFIKSILGVQNLDVSGDIVIGPSAKIGYLPQIITYKNEENSVLRTFQEYCGIGEEKARSILFKFGFGQEDVNKSVKNISGGERVKLKLAELIQNNINTLILDEPTNHIDIPTRESLEEALDDFDGTLIFVSHDRYFIKKFANKIITFKNGSAKTSDCDYTNFLSSKDQSKTNNYKKEETSKGLSL